MPTDSPRTFAMEETRRRILAGALDVLGENPDAGMGDIATAVGVVRRTVYGYFPTRADLVQTLAHEAVDELVAGLAEITASTASPERAWVDFLARLWPLAHRYRVLVALRRGEYGPEIHAVLKPVDQALADLVHEGQEAAVFGRHLPAAVLSQVAFSAVFALADTSLTDSDVTAEAATVTSLLLLGVPDARARTLADAHGHHPERSGHHERPGHGSRPGHGPAPENDTDLAELLDLDAQHAAPVLVAALDAAAAALGRAPREVVDLGAGTGTGTFALAARFAGARVHALDASAGMIERIRASAALSGLSERIETHLVDLDTDWPAAVPHEIDLAWAALSLHHTSDPSRVLRQVFDVMRPGGVVVATEFSGATTYSPADLGTGSPDLGGRVVSALATRGYPVTAEWTEVLVAAGFRDVSRHEATVAVSSRTATGARFLELQLRRNRELLADELGADDLAGLDAAIAGLGSGGPTGSPANPLEHTSGRLFWVAVRP